MESQIGKWIGTPKVDILGEPVAEVLDRGMQKVFSMTATDNHVFCGFYHHGQVAVYSLTDGLLVKELAPGLVRTNQDVFTELGGADGIIAAVSWSNVVTVWSSRPDEMEQLHCFDALDFQSPPCQEGNQIWAYQIRVVKKHKVAVLVEHGPKCSLVVLEEVDSTWVNKTMACLPLVNHVFAFASCDSHSLALVDLSSKRLTLWDGDNRLPEVLLPGCDGLGLMTISMEFPHIVASFNNENTRAALIKVFKMGDSEPSLVKTVCFENCTFRAMPPIENKHFIGFFTRAQLIVVDKKFFSPQVTTSRRSNLEIGSYRAAINATSIFIARPENEQGTEFLLEKNDFWMTNNIMDT